MPETGLKLENKLLKISFWLPEKKVFFKAPRKK
jgi:hypothetical protein